MPTTFTLERMSINQPTRLKVPLAKMISPRPRMWLLQREMPIIPRLPKMVATPLMREEAEPVSPFCWSRRRPELNGLVKDPKKLNGAKESQNKNGVSWPKKIKESPHTA